MPTWVTIPVRSGTLTSSVQAASPGSLSEAQQKVFPTQVHTPEGRMVGRWERGLEGSNTGHVNDTMSQGASHGHSEDLCRQFA